MAVPTLAQIRNGLATNLSSLTGCQTSAYRLAAITPPAVFVLGPDTVEYSITMIGGYNHLTMLIVALAGTASDKGAQVKLDNWILGTGVHVGAERDRARHNVG